MVVSDRNELQAETNYARDILLEQLAGRSRQRAWKMTLTLAIKKTTKNVLDYLRGFFPREDAYIIEEKSLSSRQGRESISQAEAPGRVLSNPEAFQDLDIGSVMNAVYKSVPRDFERGKVRDLTYLEEVFHYPLRDPEEIAERQAAITELQQDESLWHQLLFVKSNLDTCLYDERFVSSIYGLKALQEAANIVAFVLAVRQMSAPESRRLKRVKDLGRKFDQDERFREAETFIRELYLPYGLGDVIDDNTAFLRDISGVGSRREFYSGNRIILEVTERLLADERFKRFVNNEAQAVELLKTMTVKIDVWHKELFSFNLSGFDLQNWGKGERKKYSDLMEYWLLLVNEAVYARIPPLDVGDLSQELGLYLGAAAVQRKWASAGFPIANPGMVSKRERRAAIEGSFNTSLMKRFKRDEIIPNDILSSRERNVFVITGPNNGGKTTYIRQVGQMYWLAHVGMGLPVSGAELSLVDSIFTSFNTEDNTEEGTGLYLTELKRIAQFSRPASGQPFLSPYSIVFFDEFANGTDHEESVKRTKTVLDYLCQKGVTAYFTTHKHEIADMVDKGDLSGAVNLAAEVRHDDGGVSTTYRIIRNTKEKSYGYVQAEAMGITPESLHRLIEEEISQGLYPREDTRLT